MEQKTLDALKQNLLEEKKRLEEQLSSFATKDPNVKGDWDAKYPSQMREGSTDLEEAADEVEEFHSRVGVEHTLELELQKVNEALSHMEKGIYGKCEICGNDIEEERLRALPVATTCEKCSS